jgi:hypothetical protein
VKESKRSTKKPSLERNFQSRVLDDLREVPDLYVFKKEAGALRGIPDVIGCYQGKFFAWELKRDTRSKPSVLQQYHLDLINKSGGLGRVVNPENYTSCFLELTGKEP